MSVLRPRKVAVTPISSVSCASIRSTSCRSPITSLDREVEARILPLARDRGIGVIANRPFQEGVLLKRLANHPLPAWASEIDCTSWAQFVLKFIVSHPAVTCAIPATTRVDHVQENMGAALRAAAGRSDARAHGRACPGRSDVRVVDLLAVGLPALLARVPTIGCSSSTTSRSGRRNSLALALGVRSWLCFVQDPSGRDASSRQSWRHAGCGSPGPTFLSDTRPSTGLRATSPLVLLSRPCSCSGSVWRTASRSGPYRI